MLYVLSKEQYEARRAFMKARISKDVLVGKFCEKCGKPGAVKKSTSSVKSGWSNWSLHAHHEDYSKPLDVVWVCAKCHKMLHMMKGAESLSVSCPLCGAKPGRLCTSRKGGRVPVGSSHKQRYNAWANPSPLSVPCPACRAHEGERCATGAGGYLKPSKSHAVRKAAARGAR